MSPRSPSVSRRNPPKWRLCVPVLVAAGVCPAAEPVASPPVVVIAPIDPKVWQLEAPKFVQSHSKPTFISGHLARWRIGICPQTRGLSPGFNAFVSARVREVAQSSGAPLEDPAKCQANVQIIFTTEPQKLLDDVVRHAEVLLGFHWVNQTREIATVKRPIQSWYVTATVGKLGLERIDDQQEFVAAPEWGAAPQVPAGEDPTGTRIPNPPPTRIRNALIVVDSKKVEGYAIGSISDYVAMLTLAQPRSLDDCSELPSILDLFSSACDSKQRTVALSDVDLAYLKALYAVNPRLALLWQRGYITMHMKQDLGIR